MSAPRMTDVLVLAAHAPELGGLTPLLGTGLRASIGQVQVAGEAIGIGLVAAAIGAAKAIQLHGPRCVVLVGTCGVYADKGAGIAVGDVVTARRIALGSTAAASGRGAFPAPMTVRLDADPELTCAISVSLRQVDVATTLAITTDDQLASSVGETLDCAVEHLEAFAVASACAAEHVPCAVVFGVANRVGSSARDEWRSHHESAGKAATDVVAAWLRGGANVKR